MKRNFIAAIAVVLVAASPASAACKVVKAETDINRVRLGDEDSTERVLGKTEKLPLTSSDFATLTVFNRDQSEVATLTQYPGGVAGAFYAIEVLRTGLGASTENSVTLDAEHLSSERGVRLGVSEHFVTNLLGSCYKRKTAKNGSLTLRYETEDPNHPFLKRVGMPNYFAEYSFRDGRLVSFQYGSDYP